MKQMKLVFDTSSHEIHQDYLRMMSKYKEEVRKYKEIVDVNTPHIFFL